MCIFFLLFFIHTFFFAYANSSSFFFDFVPIKAFDLLIAFYILKKQFKVVVNKYKKKLITRQFCPLMILISLNLSLSFNDCC